MVNITHPNRHHVSDSSSSSDVSLTPPPYSNNMSTIAERVKDPPVCLDDSLRREAMTSSELAPLTFTLDAIETLSVPRSAAYNRNSNDRPNIPQTPPPPSTEQLNAKVSLRKTSRQGRAQQRWADDEEPVRLTTGCVPILRGGKVLFVSASRKPEWILPKGGWELDESIEESAVRECFEEAGVLGMLGPKLTEIQYETRKAKKRRLQLEDELVAKKKYKVDDTQVDAEPTERRGNNVSDNNNCDSAPYSQVRMTLFPLYVSKVLDAWPERGRFRRAVDIDQAIAMTSTRPELQMALKEVKQRGLHIKQNETNKKP